MFRLTSALFLILFSQPFQPAFKALFRFGGELKEGKLWIDLLGKSQKQVQIYA